MVNWEEINWIINAAVLACIGASVRAWFTFVKEKKQHDMDLMLWRQKVDIELQSLKEKVDSDDC